MNLYSPSYHKAFQYYLRYGISIELQLKAEQHSTTHYIWSTEGDDKVRPSHEANDGQIFAWNNPPATGHPGDEPGCRCTAVPYHGSVDTTIISEPPLNPFYPELAIVPLFRVGRLAEAWRVLAFQRNVGRTWRLGDHKTTVKWRNRLENGDWTPDKITRTIRYGKPYRAPNKPNPSRTATGYELDGNYIVVDDVTKEIIQVGEPGYIPDKLP